ncbi:mitochondrial potassium channel ATP-binding subunit [Condylostylus longicornis]|uniref:mitochondrial potassium channel ATP-binding subunit n=1 Tax=Condylostylus longicornis TaxID=2530218 RepID=UPI00244E0900|nr:mitochondrial potassium channel ATP-binding subunit [Condylostylus longicornis]
MLRLLISNCGKNEIHRTILNISRFPSNNLPNTAKDIIKSFKINKNFTKNIKNRKNTENVGRSNTKQILLSGFGISLGLGAKVGNRFFVHCEADRLSGVIQTGIDEHKDVKFDWKKFWEYLKPYFWELLGAILSALAVAYFNIKIPNLLGDLINTLAKYANTFVKDPHSNTFLSDVSRPAANLLGIYVLQSSFTFLYILLLSRIGEKMAAKIRQDLFKQIIIQDLSFFDKNRTGELVNRLTADVQDFKSSFKQFISQGLRSAAQLIGGGVSLFLISPHMAFIAIASVPLVVTFMTYLGRKLRELSKKSQAQSERATSVCEEALSNIRTVRACASEFTECELFNRETNNAAELSQQLGYGIAIFQGLTNFFLNSMVLTTLFLGGHLMSTDSLTPGQLMAFLVATQGVQRSLSQGSILLGTMVRGMTAGNRIFEYLAVQPEIDIVKGYTIPPDNLKGEIKFENVSFYYPTRSDQLILKDFNLTLKPGETIALVGASGSGKSTIAALLERFYEPTGGTIKIDGYNIKYISPYWLRTEVIGFIEQQPVLFATSVLENIRYSRPKSTEEEVMEAAKLSQCHDFVSSLPDGYDTNVGERGIQMSGGQRQRIAIARALVKEPKVLILDEATSALDASSEAEVQKALDSAIINRTTLVIAHRLSTIRNADLIVVLDKGKVVEMGKHDELMLKRGLYYDLVRQQEKQEKKENKIENVTTNILPPQNDDINRENRQQG